MKQYNYTICGFDKRTVTLQYILSVKTILTCCGLVCTVDEYGSFYTSMKISTHDTGNTYIAYFNDNDFTLAISSSS